MNDDMSYYNFEELNTYKMKFVKNILLYVVYVILFVLTNIIIYFINNDILYGVIVSIIWLLFLNLSFVYIESIVIRSRQVYLFYKMLYFGNKKTVKLKFIREEEDKLRNSLKFRSYLFLDKEGNFKELLLLKDINVTFVKDECYELLIVNDLIYGGVRIHD